MQGLLVILLGVGSFVASVVLFIISLVKFFIGRRALRQGTHGITTQDVRGRTVMLIVSAAVFAVMLAVCVIFSYTIRQSIYFM